MVAIKKKRKDLDVPQWVRDEFQKNNKNDMADLLMHCNWDKARNPILFFSCLTEDILKRQMLCTNLRPQDKFVAELEIVVKKKSSIKITRDMQWMSEKEMKDDLGWSSCHGKRTHVKLLQCCFMLIVSYTHQYKHTYVYIYIYL